MRPFTGPNTEWQQPAYALPFRNAAYVPSAQSPAAYDVSSGAFMLAAPVQPTLFGFGYPMENVSLAPPPPPHLRCMVYSEVQPSAFPLNSLWTQDRALQTQERLRSTPDFMQCPKSPRHAARPARGARPSARARYSVRAHHSSPERPTSTTLAGDSNTEASVGSASRPSAAADSSKASEVGSSSRTAQKSATGELILYFVNR